MAVTRLLERLIAEEAELQFARFTLDDAWQLGSRLREAAEAAGHPVAIAIWLGPQRVFHTALPGASADNDGWLDRKHRVVERYGRASLLVGESFRAKGEDFDTHARLDPSEFAAHGGVVPIRSRDVGVIGAVGVSGLPQQDDHDLVVAQLRAFLAERANAGTSVHHAELGSVDVSSRESVLVLVETASGLGSVTAVVHAAGVSPSQAPPELILNVDLYGTALVLEEFGRVIAPGGSAVVIASQSGHRLPALTAEEDAALATTPVEDLLALPMLQPDRVTDSLHAYQLSKRGNVLRVMAQAVVWGRRGRAA